jgi:glycolate oxidase
MNFGRIDQSIFDALSGIAGGKNIITDREKLVDFCGDEFPQEEIRHFPDVVVKPTDSGQVAKIAALANERRVPLTVRGGGTGLCGGCVPMFGGIVISFAAMNKVVEIDTGNLMAVVEPGLTLQDFYKAIEGTGLFFPPHPGDEGATMGGVIAANAGGARAVKYGVVRNFVRGLEIVLADGTITSLGGKLMKSSTGYSLINLMIGSEGTLGIVTKAIISLSPEPGAMYTLVAPYGDLHAAIKTVPSIIRNRILPMAIEFVERDSIAVTEDFMNKKWPCASGSADLMIIIDGSNEDEVMAQSERVADLCTAGGALDIFVADTKEKQRTILELRSNIYEAMRANMLEILDVTVPRATIAEFVEAIHAIEQELGMWLPTFGHAADGNVHTNIMKARWKDGAWTEIPGWRKAYPIARQRIHDLGRKFGGIVSGEHGIGIVKKEYLADFLDASQMRLMREIKRLFDPRGILNPGKIFDDPAAAAGR